MKFDQNVRQKFLGKWEGYPSYEGGSGFRFLGSQESVALVQESMGQIRQLEGSWSVFTSSDEKWGDYKANMLGKFLVPGDWIVCFEEDQSLRLMTPNRKMDFPNLGPHFSQWNQFVNFVRFWFLNRQFQSVITPTLVVSPGTEPTLDCFQTRWHLGSAEQHYFLPTSQELHMKKLLARGSGPIFEIKSVFRNGELSQLHQPEFQMLEFYRPFSNLGHIIDDLKSLIVDLKTSGFCRLSLRKGFDTLSMSELFQRHLEFELTPNTTGEELSRLSEKLGLPSDSKSYNDVFERLFVEKIEPHLEKYEVLFLKDYPPAQSALARHTVAGWSDRVELFIGGMEIANGFNELNDPDEQRKRFQSDLEEKARLGKESIPLDEEFLDHLETGCPPSAGVAVGLERLFASLNKIENLQEILEFPKRYPC